jgi:eukaryotic-like serine/threonine-protein kinase
MALPALAPALLAAKIPSLTGITFVTGGGQKSVYRADHAVHGRVALKVFGDFADPQRTQREIDAVGNIACTHVPTIFETGVINGGPKPYVWLVEEWLIGDTLRSRLASGPQSDQVVQLVARDVLFVLSEAEKKHIVHRDVKPENIFLAADNSKCWLLDFGIARHLDLSTITAAGEGLGPLSPGYAPPEQIQNYKDKIDGRADLFALGVTLYECLMGVNPYIDGAADGPECLRRTMASDLPRSTRDIDAAGQFSDLVKAMTWRRRSLRPRMASKAYEWLGSVRA